MPREVTAIAIIAARNEADIIAPVLGHLIDQGLSVYLLDHQSTDGTAEAAQPFLGRGLLAIESFPDGRFPAAEGAFAWADILARKAELSATLDADWFIHHDADEFRESPWEHLRLIDAIRRVDALGYNAIDFELFNFWPTDDEFRAGDDPRSVLRFCDSGRVWDKRQVKCWKKTAAPADLVSSGGHDVMFPGRRVFSVRFLLRHYPIRNQAQGTRKVFVERRPRFVAKELERGWHVQYRELIEGQSFLRNPEELIEYDGVLARVAVILRHREVEDLESALAERSRTVATLEDTFVRNETKLATLRDDRDRLNLHLRDRLADIDRLLALLEAKRLALTDRDEALRVRSAEIRRLDGEVEAHRALVARQATEAEAQQEAIARAKGEVEAYRTMVTRLVSDIDAQRGELEAVYASKSWRWTGILRKVIR